MNCLGMALRFGLSLLMALVAVVATSRVAHAYAQWQFSSGTVRCNQCHYAPAGGGLLRGYGRDANGEELSTFEGDGSFLHGAVALPSWLALGADIRGAFVAHNAQDPNGTKLAVFPMQFDLLGRVALPFDISFQASAGIRGRVRDDSQEIPTQNYQPITASWLVSREHFFMWQPAAVGPYVRLGRFFAPYGLRMAEHILYVRRDLGFNQLMESYNLSAGAVYDAWELHVTGFLPDFARHIGSDEGGVAALFERRILNDHGSIGLQGKYGNGPGIERTMAGVVGKLHMPSLRTMLLAEANLVHQELSVVGGSNQFVGAAGFASFPTRGLVLTVLGERNHQDIAIKGTAWNAGTVLLGWFPYPHFEVAAMGRLQFPEGQDTTQTFLFQIHYFL
ncbi:MAG: hypothetical protein SF187_11720 [Deltaproteobacteria bacterium]|nr:hypothetical protein [Deltaproteobacteria bacterium]